MKSRVQAVLFDLDGTLVDSMAVHFEAYRHVFEELGLRIDFQTFLACSGGPARDTIPRLIDGRRCSLEPSEIHVRKVAVAKRLFREMKPRALATAALLPVLGTHWPLGLVSSGSRASVSLVLEVMGWESTFRIVISGDDVYRGKPDPEGYLNAARAVEADPCACLVFEDADDGIAAARCAGMQVIDVRECVPDWRFVT